MGLQEQGSSETKSKKVKLFAWLMIKGRMKVRAVLFEQQIVDNELCLFGCKERETVQQFVLELCETNPVMPWDSVEWS